MNGAATPRRARYRRRCALMAVGGSDLTVDGVYDFAGPVCIIRCSGVGASEPAAHVSKRVRTGGGTASGRAPPRSVRAAVGWGRRGGQAGGDERTGAGCGACMFRTRRYLHVIPSAPALVSCISAPAICLRWLAVAIVQVSGVEREIWSGDGGDNGQTVIGECWAVCRFGRAAFVWLCAEPRARQWQAW